MALTEYQQELFDLIESSLRQKTALAFIQNGYSNKSSAYIQACHEINKTPAKDITSASCEILAFPSVQSFIDEVKKQASKDVGIDAAWVLAQAVKVHERCMTGEPITDKEGNKTGEWKFEHAGANKSLEIIGKHVYVKAFQENIVTEVTTKTEKMSLKERLIGASKR